MQKGKPLQPNAILYFCYLDWLSSTVEKTQLK